MPRRSTLARLLQAMLAGQLLLAVAWIAWRWAASPWQALAGALAIVLVGPAALGIELAIVACVTRHEPVPRPSVRQLLRAWRMEAAHMFATFYWRQPFRWRAQPDHLDPHSSGRAGVVLVHGFMCNRGFWNAWLRELRERGHACVAVNLEPPFASIDAYLPAIDAAVARVAEHTGRAPLLVAHSMGGLAARAWWRGSRGERPVARLVTIGTPHRGTWLARFSRRLNGRQMQLRSDWLQRLAADEAACPLPPTTCWYSSCDNVVFPATTATLPGADNRFIAGTPHVALAFHPDVRQDCLQWLAGQQVPRQGESFTGMATETP